MNKYLFNFSSSYSGGGLKRLEEFSKWFSSNGSATFLINKRSAFLSELYPNNEYIIFDITKFNRLINREPYASEMVERKFVLYYSYGIPITKKIARINVMHISNLLPFIIHGFGYNFFVKFKFLLLRYYFLNSLRNTDVLSAESNFSLSLFKGKFNKIKMLSKNGSNDEINLVQMQKINNDVKSFEKIAVVVGTNKHKAVIDSYKLFNFIKKEEGLERLKIIGDRSFLPKNILQDKNVDALGIISRKDVIKLLMTAKCFISNTKIENSFNAASEAVFISEKSYISTIEPHFELLKGHKLKLKKIPELGMEMIEVKSNEIDIRNLETWEEIIFQIRKLELNY